MMNLVLGHHDIAHNIVIIVTVMDCQAWSARTRSVCGLR